MRTEPHSLPEQYDAIIIGGSYAGLSAALQLARARRKVLVIDGGQRRNRYAAASHGFLGQDGKSPGSIVAEARNQLLAYPTVRWLDTIATTASRVEHSFEVCTESGEKLSAGYLILATGVVDILPSVEGLPERWGRSVFHCPYCHGYELERGRIGVLATSELSMHHALMLPHWGQVTLFLNEAFQPNEQQLAALEERQVEIVTGGVRRIVENATIELDDGRKFPMDGIFTATRTRLGSPLAEQLGCAIDESPMGPYIRTNETKETSISGVFACGDAARPAGNVALAVGDGAQAGVGAHRSMLFG